MCAGTSRRAAPTAFPRRLKITSINEPGTLGIVTTLIGETGANIDNLAFMTNSPDFNDILIDLDVYDLKHLTTLISRLARASGRQPRRACVRMSEQE